MKTSNHNSIVNLFDTTLRDGAQSYGVDFSLADKLAIMLALDDFGIQYIEAGWPGANPVDTSIFNNPPKLKNSKLVAFGMTRRNNYSVSNDPGLAILLQAKVAVVCLVGKSSIYQVKQILGISPEENLAMIFDSIKATVDSGKTAMYDAEHFFDGFKLDRDFALSCLQSASQAGASDIILCDTNGGIMPNEAVAIIKEVQKHLPNSSLGIHAHNDTGQAVAISMAAVDIGIKHVQATINGIGERCGNTNIITMIANLSIKKDINIGIKKHKISELKKLSSVLYERLDIPGDINAPYVGDNAFAHKGGLHGAAVSKDPKSYEHIEPEIVGNKRKVIMSNQGGRANLFARLKVYGIDKSSISNTTSNYLLDLVKQKEFEGMSYQNADASLELLLRYTLKLFNKPFHIERFRVIDERKKNSRGGFTTESEATIILSINNKFEHMVAFGLGPVNALDISLRSALVKVFPKLESMSLNDYKVRILPNVSSKSGTGAKTRVSIEFKDGDDTWLCAAISDNIIEASMLALIDAYSYRLLVINKISESKKNIVLS